MIAVLNNPSMPMMARMIVDSVIIVPPLNVWMCSESDREITTMNTTEKERHGSVSPLV